MQIKACDKCGGTTATTLHLCDDCFQLVEEKFTSTNNGSTSPAEIAAKMEAVDKDSGCYSKQDLCEFIRDWSRQLRVCR